jgi:hypothetical protein
VANETQICVSLLPLLKIPADGLLPPRHAIPQRLSPSALVGVFHPRFPLLVLSSLLFGKNREIQRPDPASRIRRYAMGRCCNDMDGRECMLEFALTRRFKVTVVKPTLPKAVLKLFFAAERAAHSNG